VPEDGGNRWAVKVLTGAVIVAAALTGAVLPANAGTSATAWGSSPGDAYSAAVAFCNRIGGSVQAGAPVIEKSGDRYKATIGCRY
jgi:hypothetical protein